MSRSIQILRRTRWLLLLAAMMLPLVLTRSARAGSYTYGSSQRTVNAGVLINGSAGSAAPDAAPYLFYLLNQRADVKPYGWNIVNPRAPSAITQDMATRWGGAPTYYTVGQSVSPNMAAYWEVPLNDVSAEQLQQYDVLYLPFAGGSILPENNEKLRRFVDGGGTLLVDYTGANLPSVTLPFLLLPGAQFTLGAAQIGLPAEPGGLTLRHPLISRPFFLGADDILNLGIPALSGGLTALANSDFSNLLTPVITQPSSAAVSAAALGGGQIVASALNVGAAISTRESYPNFPYFGLTGTSPDPEPNFTYAPAQDLKFLANVISLSDIHPTESKSGHRNGVDNDLPSFAPTWVYSLASPGVNPPAPGAATWGGFAFVTDAGGMLHAFDAFPQEDLTGTGGADDGLVDYSQGQPYDEIWKSKPGAYSAPTVGVLAGVTSVFVEDSGGNVLGYNPVTGALVTTIKPSSASSFSGFVPAPTVYGGRVYAGQSTGSLLVYDPNPGASASGGVLVPLGGTEPVVAAPAVGIISDGTANDIVALVPTNQNIYTVLLGARGDMLTPHTTGTPPTTDGYDINFNKFRLTTLIADAGSVPPSIAYNDTDVIGGTAAALGAKNPGFGLPSGSGTVYGNWDVDFKQSLPSLPSTATLTLNQISGASAGAVTNNAPFIAGFSPPAMDRSGDFYYTDNANPFSYLVGVHDNAQFQNIRMKWRFRLPAVATTADPTPLIDADGVNYEPLRGYQFSGAPVADNQGYVYAVAASGGQAVVFCFLANGDVYADNITGFDVSRATFQQPDEFNQGTPNQLHPGAIDVNLKYGQFSAVGSQATFFNFGIGAGTGHTLAGNLSEPQPVTVIPPGDPTTGVTGTPATVPLHTNLVWMTAPFAVNGGVSGLSKVGNALFFADSVNLYKLPANLTPGNGKLVTTPIPSIVAPTGAGAVAAAPAVGQGAMIVNGANGISAFTQQVTLIADNNRILEADSDGNALWSVDSTNRPVPAAGGLPASVTKVDFNHPTALSAVAANDYLVADTGNNRCVRFDRAGNVIWELTTFNDPNHLLTAGASTTLSQPASVQMRRENDPNSPNPNSPDILEHYLIADSGNFRVLEVTDTLAPGGQLIAGKDHILTFVTHTYDKDNRQFRYGSASYFQPPAPNPLLIATLVTNTRAATTPGGLLGPASNDTTGGSILIFDSTSATGQPTGVDTSFLAGGINFPMRNPRFLSLYQSTTAGAPPSFLYADDNGAFDLVYDSANKVFTTTPNSLAFFQGDYQGGVMVTLPINNGSLPNRRNLPFVPTCVQRIGEGAGNVPHYLITQSHSQGELGDPGSNAIGGEIFEVDGVNTPVGTYSGGTLSRPTYTGPLTQPTFAIRP